MDPRNQDADYLAAQLIDFCTAVFARYGEIHYIFCDSAEQTLINHIRSRLRASKLPWLADRVNNSAKIAIIDRIRLTSILMGGGRFWYLPEARHPAGRSCQCPVEPEAPRHRRASG